MENDKSCTVLVSGGTGFLGSHCVAQLLEKGHQVRTTVRSLKKQSVVEKMMGNAGISDLSKLSIIEADLSNDTNWDEAINGCDYVLHVASPFPIGQPKDENEVIKPAVDGTLRVLKAANKQGVKRVVLTSSFGAVGYTHTDESTLITEDSWTDISAKNMTSYIKSKTLAEKAAWDFIKSDDSGMELAVICPRLILGPSLGGSLNSSVKVVKRLFDGEMKKLPNVSYGIIDARDVADMHIKAMTNPTAAGERFLACSGEPLTLEEMALIIKEELGDKGSMISVKVLPNWLVKFAANFNPEIKSIVHQLGKTFKTDNSKPEKLLGWKPISREQTVIETVRSF